MRAAILEESSVNESNRRHSLRVYIIKYREEYNAMSYNTNSPHCNNRVTVIRCLHCPC